jgi:hypothetical protein
VSTASTRASVRPAFGDVGLQCGEAVALDPDQVRDVLGGLTVASLKSRAEVAKSTPASTATTTSATEDERRCHLSGLRLAGITHLLGATLS